jgi:pimeloyl-ACP methyl ester carboxylesterase
VEFLLPQRPLYVATDVVVVALGALLAIPRLAPATLTIAAIVVAAVGFATDSFLAHLPKRARLPSLALLLVVGLLGLFSVVAGFGKVAKELAPVLPSVGITRAYPGERIELETGSVAWLNRPAGRSSALGALLFHGAHGAGSMQVAASVLRRALVEAGFVVLAVDHPGYGQSPTPEVGAGIEVWDPLPSALEALERLGSTSGVEEIVLVGHSMGCTDVLRVLGTGPKVRKAILFGANLPSNTERDVEYWYRRFHSDRWMSDRIPMSDYREIRRRYSDSRAAVQALPRDHGPILFVRFGREHADIMDTRDEYYALIPGSKALWVFEDSTHYFSVRSLVHGLMVGNTRISRRLADRLAAVAEGLRGGS